MHLDPHKYDFSTVIGSGTTTAAQEHISLSGAARWFALNMADETDTAEAINIAKTDIERYMAMDVYSKILVRRPTFLRWTSRTTLLDTTAATKPTEFEKLYGSSVLHSPAPTATSNTSVSTFKSSSLASYDGSELNFFRHIYHGEKTSGDSAAVIFKEISEFGLANPSVKDLSTTIRKIDVLTGSQNYRELTRLIKILEPSRTSSAHLVAVLRTTGIFARKIGGWHEFRDRSADVLQARSIDTSKVLRGLY